MMTNTIHLLAVVTEKTAPTFGQAFATTKTGTYKGMNEEQFRAAVKCVQVFNYEIRPINMPTPLFSFNEWQASK